MFPLIWSLLKPYRLTLVVIFFAMLLGSRAIIGSINLAPGSFDSRRELAIEVHKDAIVERLQKIAHHDWNIPILLI